MPVCTWESELNPFVSKSVKYALMGWKIFPAQRDICVLIPGAIIFTLYGKISADRIKGFEIGRWPRWAPHAITYILTRGKPREIWHWGERGIVTTEAELGVMRCSHSRIPRCGSGIFKNDEELTGENLDKTLRQGNHLGKTQRQAAFKQRMFLYDSGLGPGEGETEGQQETKLKKELRIR